MNKYFLTLAFAMISSLAMAQNNKLDVDVQFRARGEYQNGYGKLRSAGESPKLVGNERARIGVTYQYKDLVEAKVSGQHVGLWNSDGANGYLGLNEAWAKLKYKGLFAQVGRQTLAYDDERILGGSDWKPSGTWHDALRVGYESEINKVHLIFAFKQHNGEERWGKFYSGAMPYKSMQTLWYHYQSSQDAVGVSAIFMNVGREAADGSGKTKYVQTMGTDINYTHDAWDYHFAMYFQTGRTIYNEQRRAMTFSGRVGYTINPEWYVFLGYDNLGGNDGDGNNMDKAFEALYGSNHLFYGLMDYFPGKLYYGLQDLHAGVKSSVVKKVKMQLDWHFFSTAHEVNKYRNLGYEFDYQLSTKLH